MSQSTSPTGPAAALVIDPAALRPILEEITLDLLHRLRDAEAKTAGRLAYSEAEAAALIGLHQHQLRDERLRGRISASIIVGRRIAYLPQDLTAYLMRERVNVA